MSSPSSEKALSSDVEVRLREFCRLRHKVWLGNTDPDLVVQMVEQALQHEHPEQGLQAIELGNALFMWQIGTPWWGRAPILMEELLFSIDGSPVDMHRVLAFAEQYAKNHGCAGIAFGTSLSNRDRALVRLLESHGFAAESTVLYKGIT